MGLHQAKIASQPESELTKDIFRRQNQDVSAGKINAPLQAVRL
jgi:hypothetical protein